MQYSKFLSTALMLVSVTALPSPLEQRDPVEHLGAGYEGYTLTEPTWTYDLPNNKTLEVTGPVEKLIHELNFVYPEWKNDESIYSASEATAVTAKRDETSPNPLAARAIWTHHYCHFYDYYPARITDIRGGIGYLYGLSGGPSIGGKSCHRISCSWDSAIFLCNNNDHHINIQGWAWPADSAWEILKRCGLLDCPICDTVIGFINEIGNWNVHIRGDSNNC